MRYERLPRHRHAGVARRRPRGQRLRPREPRPHAPAARLLEPVGGPAVRGGHLPPRGTRRRRRRVRRQHGRAHRARGGRQVHRQRGHQRAQGLVGRVQPPLHAAELHVAGHAPAGLPAGPRRVRAGRLRRRRPRAPPARPHHLREGLAQPVCADDVREADRASTGTAGTCRSSRSSARLASRPRR